jgi:hypothetical protein
MLPQCKLKVKAFPGSVSGEATFLIAFHSIHYRGKFDERQQRNPCVEEGREISAISQKPLM